jgi:hypothetical protein
VDSCLVEPQSYDASNNKSLGQTPIYKQVNNDNLLNMNTHEQHERMAVEPLVDYATSLVLQYTAPEDFEAACVAVLCRAIESIAKKEMEICFKQNATTTNN